MLYVAQHCANSICSENQKKKKKQQGALQWLLRVFPPAEMQNQSSLGHISVAPTQLHCHPISFDLWADNSGKRHQKTLLHGCSSVLGTKWTQTFIMAGKCTAQKLLSAHLTKNRDPNSVTGSIMNLQSHYFSGTFTGVDTVRPGDPARPHPHAESVLLARPQALGCVISHFALSLCLHHIFLLPTGKCN